MLQKLQIYHVLGCFWFCFAVSCATHYRSESPDIAVVQATRLLPQAVCVLKPLGKEQAEGSLQWHKQSSGGLLLKGNFWGLAPHSKHALHIHEVADCSKADGSSAGPHFNPEKGIHGAPGGEHVHLGDLGNIQADERGEAHITLSLPWAEVGNGELSILKHSVILHREADDFQTQPSGNSGDRIACGVIVSHPSSEK